MPVAWARCDIFLFSCSGKQGKRLPSVSEENYEEIIIHIFKIQLLNYLLRSCFKFCSVLCLWITTMKCIPSLPLKNSVWLRTGLECIRGMKKFFGNTIEGEMRSLYSNSFSKGGGYLEYQIPSINLVGGGNGNYR